MRRLILLLLILSMFVAGARVERKKLLQERQDASERLYMLRSAEVALDIPLTGNMTWKDMLGRK